MGCSRHLSGSGLMRWASAELLDGVTQLRVSFWFNAAAVSGTAVNVFGIGNGSQFTGNVLVTLTSTAITVVFGEAGSSLFSRAVSATTAAYSYTTATGTNATTDPGTLTRDQEWHHLAFDITLNGDGSADSNIWIDGSLEDTHNEPAGMPSAFTSNANSNVTIGMWSFTGGSANYYSGEIADPYVGEGTWSSEDVALLYDTGVGDWPVGKRAYSVAGSGHLFAPDFWDSNDDPITVTTPSTSGTVEEYLGPPLSGYFSGAPLIVVGDTQAFTDSVPARTYYPILAEHLANYGNRFSCAVFQVGDLCDSTGNVGQASAAASFLNQIKSEPPPVFAYSQGNHEHNGSSPTDRNMSNFELFVTKFETSLAQYPGFKWHVTNVPTGADEAVNQTTWRYASIFQFTFDGQPWICVLPTLSCQVDNCLAIIDKIATSYPHRPILIIDHIWIASSGTTFDSTDYGITDDTTASTRWGTYWDTIPNLALIWCGHNITTSNTLTRNVWSCSMDHTADDGHAVKSFGINWQDDPGSSWDNAYSGGRNVTGGDGASHIMIGDGNGGYEVRTYLIMTGRRLTGSSASNKTYTWTSQTLDYNLSSPPNEGFSFSGALAFGRSSKYITRAR